MNDTRSAVTDQYLTFKMDEEMYAVDVAQVQRVLEDAKIMKVPGAPPYMRGIMNMMGSPIPVIDLKRKFGIGDTERSVDSCIIVFEVRVGEEKTVIGALADSVDEVIELGAGAIEAAPTIGTSINRRYIRGIGKRNGEFMMVLDCGELFSGEDLATIDGPKDAAEHVDGTEA